MSQKAQVGNSSGSLTLLIGGEEFRARDARDPGFYRIDKEIIDDHLAAIGVYGLAVYNMLAYHARNATSRCWPSISGIAKRLGVSEPTVRKALEKLVSEKLVILQKQPDRKGKNGKVIPQPYMFTLLDVKPKKGVVNDVYQGGKPGLPGVVNDVYPNYTNINKTQEQENIFSPRTANAVLESASPQSNIEEAIPETEIAKPTTEQPIVANDNPLLKQALEEERKSSAEKKEEATWPLTCVICGAVAVYQCNDEAFCGGHVARAFGQPGDVLRPIPDVPTFKAGDRVLWATTFRGGWGYNANVFGVVMHVAKKKVRILIHNKGADRFEERSVDPDKLKHRDTASVYEPLDTEADRRRATVNQPKPEKPSCYGNRDIFDALADTLFSATDDVDRRVVGAKTGIIREALIDHVLAKRSESNLSDEAIGMLCAHIRMFKTWWGKKRDKDGKPLTPPRKDATSFLEQWIDYVKSDEAKTVGAAPCEKPKLIPCGCKNGFIDRYDDHGHFLGSDVCPKCEGKGRIAA